MKKIIQILVLLVFMGITFLSFQNYTENEFAKLIGKSYYTVDIQKKNEHVITVLNTISEKEEILIGKYVYDYTDNEKAKISLYVSSYNQEFLQTLAIQNIRTQPLGNGYYYTTDKNDKNENVLGYIHVANANLSLTVKGLVDLDIKNSANATFIDAKNDKHLNKVLAQLEQTGIPSKYDGASYYLGNTIVYTLLNSIGILICLVLFLLLALIYATFKDYKKYAIYESLGYAKKGIILIEFIQNFKMILRYLCFFIIFLLLYSVYKFSALHPHFIYYFIKQYCILAAILLGIIYASLQLIYFVDIKDMIKNRYPFKLIYGFSLFSKIITSMILVIAIVNSFVTIQTIQLESSMLSTWDQTKNLYYTGLNNFEPDEAGSYYEMGSKFQKLYSDLEKQKAILFKYNIIDNIGGIKLKQVKENDFQTYSIYINNNYLQKHAVYDTNNNRITNLNMDNDLIVMIPEKYKSLGIEPVLSQNKKNSRYQDENIYRTAQGLSKLNSSNYTVRFMYINDSQKFFSYDNNINKSAYNYIYDPIIYVCNDKNMSTDFYISTFSNGGIYVDSALKQTILANVETKSYITGIMPAYDRIANVILDLEQKLKVAGMSLIFVLLVYILMIILTSLYYLKMNQIKFHIMKLHGYSTWNMCNRYILGNLMISLITIFLLLYMSKQVHMTLVILFLIFLAFELCILYNTLKFNYHKTWNQVK